MRKMRGSGKMKRSPKKICSDCWSPVERKLKNGLEIAKAFLFCPILLILSRFGITPNMVTIFSAFLGVVSAIFVGINRTISVLLLAGAVIGDGLDGAMARKTKNNDAKGSVTDCFYDQVVITATTMAYAQAGMIRPAIAVYYGATYPILIIFSIIRNRLGIPNHYVLRPRMIIYGLFTLYVFSGINVMNEAAGLFSMIFTGYIFNDFYTLKKRT